MKGIGCKSVANCDRLQSVIVMCILFGCGALVLVLFAVFTHSLISGFQAHRFEDAIMLDRVVARFMDQAERCVDEMQKDVERIVQGSTQEMREKYAEAQLQLDNTILRRSADHPTHDVFVLEFHYVPERELAVNRTVDEAIEGINDILGQCHSDAREVLQTTNQAMSSALNVDQVKEKLNLIVKKLAKIWQMAIRDIAWEHTRRRLDVLQNYSLIDKAVAKYLPNGSVEVTENLWKANDDIEASIGQSQRRIDDAARKGIQELSRIRETATTRLDEVDDKYSS